MNRYKLRYGPGSAHSDLPAEIVADRYLRIGAYTNFYRESENPLTPSTVLHSIANKAIVHIELIEENVRK